MSEAVTVGRRLSTAYFAYYATIGLEYVYLPFFFTRIGLTPGEVGVLYAGRIAVMIVFQPLTTRVADLTGKPYATLKLAMLVGLVCASGLYVAHGLAVAAAFMWSQAAFRSVAIPILDATTIHERGADNYGRVRLWGSVGYGLSTLGLAVVMGAVAYDEAGATALPVYLGANALMVIAMFCLPSGMRMEHARTEALPPSRAVTPGVIALMVIGALHWASVETYNVFFSSYVRWRGFAADVPGFGVAAGIVSEVLIFYFLARFFRRAPAASWLLVALTLSILRWVATALAPEPWLLVIAQAGHAFSFALWWGATLAVFGLNAPTSRRAALQGIFTAAVMGCGGALGTIISGRVFERYGGQTMFLGAAAMDVLAVAIALATRRLWWKAPTAA